VKFGSLFTGIGGLDLACEAVGWTCAWQVEIDPFCREVLSKHWPAVPRYKDVRTVSTPAVPSVDVLVGGFPCQDVSLAGKRRGIHAGERSGLWFEFERLVRELAPEGVLVENVGGLAGRDLDTVASGLHRLGYEVEVSRIAAADVGAPHRRIRHFIVGFRGGVADAAVRGREGVGIALASGLGRAPGHEPNGRREAGPGEGGGVADAAGARCERREPTDVGAAKPAKPHRRDPRGVADAARDPGPAEPGLGRDPHGVPSGLDGPGPGGGWPAARGLQQESWEPPRTVGGVPKAGRPARLKALGNAVVPQQGFVAALRLRELLWRQR